MVLSEYKGCVWLQCEHSVVLSEYKGCVWLQCERSGNTVWFCLEYRSADSLGEPSSWRPLEASPFGPFPLDALAIDAFPLDALAAVAFPLDVLAIEALPLTTWCLEVWVSWPSSSAGRERENRLQRENIKTKPCDAN